MEKVVGARDAGVLGIGGFEAESLAWGILRDVDALAV